MDMDMDMDYRNSKVWTRPSEILIHVGWDTILALVLF